MHLLRGCGLAGLRGMPSRRGPFVRPLLTVWRSDVMRYLGSRGVAAIEDPANSNLSYARVRMRKRLLPALERDRPGIVRRLHAAASSAAAMQDTITAQAGGTCSRAAIASMSLPVAAECLRTLYAAAGGELPSLSHRPLHAILLPPAAAPPRAS